MVIVICVSNIDDNGNHPFMNKELKSPKEMVHSTYVLFNEKVPPRVGTRGGLGGYNPHHNMLAPPLEGEKPFLGGFWHL